MNEPQVIYRTEYILRTPIRMKPEELDKEREKFVKSIKGDGVAAIDTLFKVETYEQPTAVILPDGNIVKLETRR